MVSYHKALSLHLWCLIVCLLGVSSQDYFSYDDQDDDDDRMGGSFLPGIFGGAVSGALSGLTGNAPTRTDNIGQSVAGGAIRGALGGAGLNHWSQGWDSHNYDDVDNFDEPGSSRAEPECKISDLRLPRNAVISPRSGSLPLYDYAMIRCRRGYKFPRGSRVVYVGCEAGGKWEQTRMQECKPKRKRQRPCDTAELFPPMEGSVSPSGRVPYKGKATFACPAHFILKGDAVVKCGRRGVWKPHMPPTCVRSKSHTTLPPRRTTVERTTHRVTTTTFERTTRRVTTSRPVKDSSQACGKPAVSLNAIRRHLESQKNVRIVGGGPALKNSWPWAVQLSVAGTPTCGASLLDDQWLVTAAHCFKVIDVPDLWEAGLGKHAKASGEVGEVKSRISRIIVHPNYNKPGHKAKDHDIALVKLDRPISFSEKISPICLPAMESQPSDGTECVVSGWGSTKGTGNDDVLKQTPVPVYGAPACERSFTTMKGKLSERMMCAGYELGGTDACQGDSGGPFVCEDGKGGWVLQGVVSWGIGCAQKNAPGVYTVVGKFIDWITKHIPSLQTSGKPADSISYDAEEGGTPTSTRHPVVIQPVKPPRTGKPSPGPGARTCGKTRGDAMPEGGGRIVGGSPAKPHAYPWQTLLLLAGRPTCGGSIINDRWIVTAAHCFKIIDAPDLWKVVLGKHQKRLGEADELDVPIEKIVVHPDYNRPTKKDNDIAMIKLKRAVTFSSKVSPICLPSNDVDLENHRECVVSGWGDTRGTGHADVLKYAVVPIYQSGQCQTDFSQMKGRLTDNMFCAGYQIGGTDACQGDSGGPLACQDRVSKRWILNGVVSWGLDCAKENRPGVYTDVSHYTEWIEKTVSERSRSSDMRSSNVFVSRAPLETTTPRTTTMQTTVHRTTNTPAPTPQATVYNPWSNMAPFMPPPVSTNFMNPPVGRK